MRSSKHTWCKATAHKANRPFVGVLLKKALNSPWRQRARVNMTESDLENHGHRIESLLEVMETFEASDSASDQIHQDLVRLVYQVAYFQQNTPLRDLLATLTNADMNLHARERLLKSLGKIARYYEVAKFLCQQAEVVPMLRNATVRSVQLPMDAFARVSPAGIASHDTIASTLDSLLAIEQGSAADFALPPRVQKSLARETFAPEVNKTLKSSKIHAEIQILAHYKEEGAAGRTVLRPRVIASSKDACFMCHAFLGLHGQYRVPKTHGRLYGGWRLPATLGSWQQRLGEYLEQRARVAWVRILIEGDFPAIMRYPNESTLFSLSLSASLLSSRTSLPLASNHSSLDLVVTAPAAEASCQEFSETSHLLQTSHAGTAGVAGLGRCGANQGSDDKSDDGDDKYCGCCCIQ